MGAGSHKQISGLQDDGKRRGKSVCPSVTHVETMSSMKGERFYEHSSLSSGDTNPTSFIVNYLAVD